MPAKIRLQRHGKKGNAFYHIVVADSRAPRDGKFIERIGSYNPNTNPATIDLNVEKGVKWLQNGAQPTDTVRGILSYKGVLYKHHLLGGVAKGALTLEQAETKFTAWLEAKETKINAKKTGLANTAADKANARLAEEVKIKEERAAAIAAKNAPVAEAPAEEAAAEEVETPATEENNEAAAE
ncbi:30S ribosomal protein S16 [Solitalea longa]|uniref:Small ribosomal subunit protein bS16 n=1 Tax=Solitalea longa TaxID=2079460 RepID=A0A2S5A4H7_9SPHI|nr:30S ribosomal protein S16 [Solitalea longa]POY37197.1 30S ribosomal protein S16 [Solitalea longa]